MIFLISKCRRLIFLEMIKQEYLICARHQQPSRKILHKVPCVGENHGKNGLLCTILFIRHIRQSFAGEFGIRGLSKNIYRTLFIGFFYISDDG